MKYLMLLVSLVGITNVLCHWSVKNAKSFDDELQSLEDFNQYIRSVRKLYNRPKFAPDSNSNVNRGGFEVEGNQRLSLSADKGLCFLF